MKYARRAVQLMRHLGVLRGTGTLWIGGKPAGRANYEFDGYLVKPGEVVASGEVRMSADVLGNAFGRADLTLQTDDGRTLALRFSGKRLSATSSVAHADVRGGLPDEKEWRRG